MSLDHTMQTAGRFLTNAEALAAIVARLRLEELGVEGDPAVRRQLDRVIACAGAADLLAGLSDQERAIVISFGRSYLRQALDLVEDPARAGAWEHTDPALLQAQGAASALVASLIDSAGLGHAGLRILDVGTGVAGLAIAFCQTFTDSTVVGVDPWEPALSLARANVAAAGLETRIDLRPIRIEDLVDEEGFDLTWLPAFFLPEAILDTALRRVLDVTRPGGQIVVGAFDGPDDPLAAATDDLRTVRSGGSVLDPIDAIHRLETAGFVDAREVERTWAAPLRLVVGRRP